MIISLIGKKIYQKQGFLQNGARVPLTGVNVMGNVITQIMSLEKEGYNALQLGIETNKKARKSIVNHSKNAGLDTSPRFFREIRVDSVADLAKGTVLNVDDVFHIGDIVDVTGVSKGKGWAGVVKRYGFRGGPRTHGQSDRERAPGSIGQATTPGRVFKGKKMAGRMGQDTVTVKNLEIIEITSDGVLQIKGLVPGGVNSVLTVKKIGENKKFVPLYKEVSEKDEVHEESKEVENVPDQKEEVELKVDEPEIAAVEVPVEESQIISDASVTENKKEEVENGS